VRADLARLTKILDLASGDRERVLNRDLGVLVGFLVRRRAVDDHVFLGGIVSRMWIWKPAPCRWWSPGPITVTLLEVMRLSRASIRSNSRSTTARA